MSVADNANRGRNAAEAAAENRESNPAAIAWNSVDFERRYRDHLKQPGSQTVIVELSDRACERDVWLVCRKKDVHWCHRRLPANTISAQIEDIEVVHHPDPSTNSFGTDDNESDDDAESTLANFAEAGDA
ncbi:DUF488 family protein [Natrinema longum]|uniref:DUF488 family protein n=1 Tax=Natrinema longum TaxID=370324 RepID=A0A8A2U9S1_9EURY|nr:DUF488 family protein [Natrinema longum]MBZ6496566.1 DUF488 domain-containing protein [Natrinema longum]QSW85531.1 DUF488 family protein [Natrinema longum]